MKRVKWVVIIVLVVLMFFILRNNTVNIVFNILNINHNEREDGKTSNEEYNNNKCENGIYIGDVYLQSEMFVLDLKSSTDINFDTNIDVLLKNETIKVNIHQSSSSGSTTIYIENDTKSSLDLDKCIISGVMFSEVDNYSYIIKDNEYLYMGSKRSTVINILGEPDRSNNNNFYYTFGAVYFNDDGTVRNIIIDDIKKLYKIIK